MIGKKFGKLLVISDSGERTNERGIIWNCICDCGNKKKVSGKYLVRKNRPITCGCSRSEYSRRCFEDNIEKTETCWLWKGSINQSGYGRIGINKLAHRESYKYYIGKIPKGMQVCHSCDVRNCVAPHHFFLGSIGDNMRDKMSKKRQARGSKIGNSILTEDKVLEIRKMRLSGKEYQELADYFGISWYLVRSICKNRQWKHVALGEECSKMPQLRKNAVGEATGQSKLTENHVRQIRNMISKGIKGKDIANQFGVNSSTICDIKTRRTWSHLD